MPDQPGDDGLGDAARRLARILDDKPTTPGPDARVGYPDPRGDGIRIDATYGDPPTPEPPRSPGDTTFPRPPSRGWHSTPDDDLWEALRPRTPEEQEAAKWAAWRTQMLRHLDEERERDIRRRYERARAEREREAAARAAADTEWQQYWQDEEAHGRWRIEGGALPLADPPDDADDGAAAAGGRSRRLATAMAVGGLAAVIGLGLWWTQDRATDGTLGREAAADTGEQAPADDAPPDAGGEDADARDDAAPAEDVPDGDDEPVALDDEPAEATMAAIAYGCPDIGHRPMAGYPDSPSSIIYAFMMAGIDAALADGTRVTLDVGADAPADAVLDDGMATVEFPISSYGDYPVDVVVAETPDGTPLEVLGAPPTIEVGPDEGPVGGCVPPQDMTQEERDAEVARTLLGIEEAGGAGGPPPPGDDLTPVRVFLTNYDAAHRDGDVDTLLDALDPAVIDLYGADQCRGYLSGVAGSISDLELLDARAEPWTWEPDGHTIEVPDAWTVQMEATVQDTERQPFTFHLRPVDDGMTWFTDCGDPR